MTLFGIDLNLERLKIDNLYAAYLGMNSRQQTMALVGLGVLLFFVIVVPLTVASGSIRSLEKRIVTGEQDLKKVMRQIDSYNAVKAELDALEASLAGGFDSSIATTLETLADKAGIKDRIDALKEKPRVPSDLIEQASVDVRLKKVALSELTSFLFDIEHHPTKILKLEKLDIQPRYDSKNELNASFTVSTFRFQERVE